ncbi:MAG: S41 family peptidase [Planctomycetota bacterium]|jgi:carboxyl-terminal processing protease
MARRIPVFVLMLVLLGGISAAGAPAEKAEPPKEDYYELYSILVDAIDQVERNYVKEYDRRELIEAAIEGVLSKLDPYSSYINPEEISRFRSTVESEFGGIGIQLAPDPRQLTIFSPLVGTPAYRAGLLAGDRIVEIEGESTEGMKMEEAIRRLKGKPGTQVKMAVTHRGKKDKVEVTLTREIIHVDTVLGDRRKEDDTWDFMLRPEEQIGYVRVTAFSRDTSRRELRPVLEQLRSDGLKGLILDLRFNPGGLLNSAVEVSDMFISEGRIVSTRGRNSPEKAWDAKKEGTFEGFPMVVLVNRYSASASEIVSACLQDHKRAVIMGERTWGKGSVQNVIELAGGQSLLKLTTASYRRPSGKDIHRFHGAKEDQQEWGVAPDKGFDLRLSDAEMEGLILDRRRRDVVRPKPDEAEEAEEKAEEPDQPEGKPAEEADDGQQQPKPEEDPQHPADETSEDDDQATQSDDTATEEPEEPAFVDRQLQMAVDYLTERLARAG